MTWRSQTRSSVVLLCLDMCRVAGGHRTGGPVLTESTMSWSGVAVAAQRRPRVTAIERSDQGRRSVRDDSVVLAFTALLVDASKEPTEIFYTLAPQVRAARGPMYRRPSTPSRAPRTSAPQRDLGGSSSRPG